MLDLHNLDFKYSLITSFLAILFEYIVVRPLVGYARDKNNRQKLISFLWMAISLIIPLWLFQALAVGLVTTLTQSFGWTEYQRMSIYANFFAAFSLIWGISWGSFIRRWLA